MLNKTEIRIIADITECEKLWREFSPNESLFDLWEFRFAIYQAFKYPPYFILLHNEKDNLALLPLWFDTDRNEYHWFASEWPEDNQFFTKKPEYLQILLSACPKPLFLYSMSYKANEQAGKIIQLEKERPKAMLDIKNFKSIDDYLKTISKKIRHNLKRDKKNIESQNPKIFIDREGDLQNLIQLNLAKHHDSCFTDKKEIASFENLKTISETTKAFTIKTIAVEINNQLAGVDFVIIYKDTYYPMTGGNNVKDFPGIGAFLNLFDIEDAIQLGLHKIDFLECKDDDYKLKLFSTQKQYKLELV